MEDPSRFLVSVRFPRAQKLTPLSVNAKEGTKGPFHRTVNDVYIAHTSSVAVSNRTSFESTLSIFEGFPISTTERWLSAFENI